MNATINNCKKYYPELDGLRGLAALMVFFSHTMGLLPPSNLMSYLQQSPFRILWDGAAAVDFFFVLSGFVLALPFATGKAKLNYVSYGIRRAFRIYPAYWLAIAISVICHYFYDSTAMNELSKWPKSLWLSPITIDLVARHMTLILKTDTRAIDPVAWTLIIEMRMSLILPLFIIFLNRTHNVWSQIALIVSIFLSAALTDKLIFFPHFALGACLAKNHLYFQHTLSTISRSAVLCLSIIIIFLYGNRWILDLELESIIQSYVTAIASFLLIIFATNGGRTSIILKSDIFGFLGKTSYSFYLLHLPILLLVVSTIYLAANSLVLAFLISLITTYGLAIIFYHFVEIPAIKLGKKLTQN